MALLNTVVVVSYLKDGSYYVFFFFGFVVKI